MTSDAGYVLVTAISDTSSGSRPAAAQAAAIRARTAARFRTSSSARASDAGESVSGIFKPGESGEAPGRAFAAIGVVVGGFLRTDRRAPALLDSERPQLCPYTGRNVDGGSALASRRPRFGHLRCDVRAHLLGHFISGAAYGRAGK